MISKKWAAIATLVTLVLVVGTCLLFFANQTLFSSLVEEYGYLGIFLTSFFGSSTIFFVMPTDILVFSSGAFLDPLIVGIVAGIGKTLGESIGYLIGLGGREIIDRRYKKEILKWESAFKKHGGFFIILLFAATPLPDDIVGIVGGTLKYPFRKFLLASLIGKIALSLTLSYAGFYGMDRILNIISPLA